MSYPPEIMYALHSVAPNWRSCNATVTSYVDYFEAAFDDITVEIVPTGRAVFIIEGDRTKIRELLQRELDNMDSQARKART